MKVRAGFVSNSSSSSFAIVGVSFRSEEDLIEALTTKWPNKNDIPGYTLYGDDEEGYLDSSEADEHCGGLNFVCDSDSDTYIAGMGYESMKPDETRDQFEARIAATIKEYLGIDAKPRYLMGEISC
jgi:hypothetical protein